MPVEPRFLLDANVSRTVKEYLEGRGFDVAWIIEDDPRMSDDAILALAYDQDRILVTVDKDFGDLIFHQRRPCRGVIRLEDARPTMHIHLLRTLLDRHPGEITNHFIVVERGSIRIRDL